MDKHPNHDTAVALIRAAVARAQRDGIPIVQRKLGVKEGESGEQWVYEGDGVCAIGAFMLGQPIGIRDSELLGVPMNWPAAFAFGFDNRPLAGDWPRPILEGDNPAWEAGRALAEELGLP
jgi:hypothetical protein